MEDNEQIRTTLARILNRDGHNVQAEGTCAAAITAAHGQPRTDPFQILISDLGLPDDSGLNLVQKLKSEMPSLTAIALSGYGTDGDIQKSLQAGFTTHLTKPIGIEDLRHALVA